ITAKNLATEITNYTVAKEDLHGEDPITDEHVRNNQDVRDLLVKRGIKPETLPSEEDLKKLERRVRKQEKHLPDEAGKINSRQTHRKNRDIEP
ncbi:MAG: DNA damage-inducible protein D, partial [Methanoregula sp.]|nr:DNA damage-inducible protein D [Methanoregula sp.]